jgi:hypothetical protein
VKRAWDVSTKVTRKITQARPGDPQPPVPPPPDRTRHRAWVIFLAQEQQRRREDPTIGRGATNEQPRPRQCQENSRAHEDQPESVASAGTAEKSPQGETEHRPVTQWRKHRPPRVLGSQGPKSSAGTTVTPVVPWEQGPTRGRSLFAIVLQTSE